MFLAEAEIKDGKDLSCFSIAGYNLILSETYVSKGKARIIALVKRDTYEVMNVQNNSRNELIFLQKENCIVVGGYRPFKLNEGEKEKSNFDRMMACLDSVDCRKRVIITGDFNIDLEKGRFAKEMLERADEKGLEFPDIGVTRVRKVMDQIQKSAIDIVMTNVPELKVSKEFGSLSDHCLLKIGRQKELQIPSKKEIEYFDWRRYDRQKATEFLKSRIEPLMFDEMNSEEADYQIRASVKDAFNQFLSVSTIKIRAFEVVSPKIIKLKNLKKRKRKLWLRDGSPEAWVNFMDASKKLRNEVKKVKKAKLQNKMKKSTVDFWKEVSCIKGKNEMDTCKILHEGAMITEKQKIADVFVESFLQKTDQHIQGYNSMGWMDLGIDRDEGMEAFTTVEIIAAFGRLSNKKSTGMDGISGYFLKEMSSALVKPIQCLFNKIVRTFSIPDTWKIARITPVFKKGNPLLTSNFRPVSNLLSISKLFELCILGRLEKYDLDDIMGKSQHGFRSGHSTDTAVSEVISHIAELRDKKRKVLCYSMDLTAAFDLLRKEVLAKIMVEKGIPVGITRIIFEYLKDCQGYVQIGRDRSCVRDIKLGCVQGSILGPFLFNVYTSGISDVVNPWKATAYADDTYVVIEGESEMEVIDQFKISLKKHEEWLKGLGMICNRSKTEVVIFGDEMEREIEVDGINIKSGTTMKMLGIWVDSDLKWNTHVTKLANKCRSLGYAIRFLGKHLSQEQMRLVFLSHFVGRLSYGCPVWFNGINSIQKQNLRSVYYKQIRIIVHDYRRSLNRNLLSKNLMFLALTR